MNDEKTTRNNWQGLIPRGRSAIISLVIVAIVAFSLGGLLLGEGESTNGSEEHMHVSSAESAEPTMWTCSMHPQIRLPKPGKCPICFMDLIPVETGSAGGELDPNQIRLSETAVKLAGIQTTPVTRAYAERSIRMVGKLDYDETRVSYITAWVPGRLDSLFVDYTGATVSKGDHMVQMYSPELVAAQEELLQANKAVATLNSASSVVLKSTANETLKSAREKLRLYGLSEKQVASIEQGNAPSEHLTIDAPASGVVVHKDAKEGMYVSTGTRIYTIADLTRLWVLLEAYESDLTWLRNGQTVSFTSPSFPGKEFTAKISFIDPVVNPRTRTVKIRAVVSNKDQRLKPEMFVSAAIKSSLDSEGKIVSPDMADKSHDLAPLLIPASAPLITGKRAVVYVMIPSDEGMVFEGREVILGPRSQGYYVVKQGLVEGDQVVTNGAFKIDSELQIQAKPSMMSLQGGAAAAGHKHDEAMTVRMVAEQDMPYVAGTADRLDDCEEAQKALIPVYSAYFDVQMALANDDLDRTKKAFDDIKEAVHNVDMMVFEGKAHMRWMDISGRLAEAAVAGESSGSLVNARDAFFNLSQAAIELHDTFGHASDESFYLTFCPMARENAGAYWLQQENIVWNSFYGESMLRCGEIKKELQATGDAMTE